MEAEAQDAEVEVERSLAESMDVAGEARAILTELLMVDPREQTTLWLLRGSILSAVDHVLVPLKLEDRARLRQQQSSKLLGTNPGNLLIRDMLTSRQADRIRSLVARPIHAVRLDRAVPGHPARRRPRHRPS